MTITAAGTLKIINFVDVCDIYLFVRIGADIFFR